MEMSVTDVKREMVCLANFKKANNPEGIQEVLMKLANTKELDFNVAVVEIFEFQGGAN